MSKEPGAIPVRSAIIKRIKSKLSLKQLIWITLAVLVAVLPQVYRLPMWFLPMTVVVLGYRFYSQIYRIPKTYNAILILVSLLALVMIIYSQGFGLSREISVTILITMTVLKLLETYQMRDALLVVILCYFVTMTRFLYSQDMFLLLYLIVSIWVITQALNVLNYEGDDRWFNAKEISRTGGWIALAIPFAALFFLAFPRLGSPIWGSPDIFGEGKTGISDTMQPGSIIELFMDDSPAFRVTFDGDEVPANNQLYWRGPVLWNFDGVMWSRQRHDSIKMPIKTMEPSTTLSYQIELEPTGQNYLFGLDYVSRSNTGAMLLPDSTLYSITKINQLKHYNLTTKLQTQLSDRLIPFHRRLLLAYPLGSNNETKAMIDQWLSQSSNKYEIINKTLRHFNQNEFYYSYSPPPLSGDVIDQFLFESKRGFCEHYASTFTIMMRMAGIPARVVTGYQGGINNGDYILVKQSDAHAWSEVFIEESEGVGYWQRVDPTATVAPERVERGSRQIMDSKRTITDYDWLINIREFMDQYRYQWNQWVRDYNVSKQQALFDAIGVKQRDGKSIAIMLITIISFTTLIVVVVLWYLQRQTYLPVQRIYLRFAKLFKQDQALYQQHTLGLEHFSQTVKQQHPELSSSINHFVNLYVNLRYNDKQTEHQKISAHLNQVIDKIRQQLKQSQQR